MLKIFVTGDNHIGIKHANKREKSRMVAERTEAFSRMVQKANDEDCGLFAVTGDLFDSTDVDGGAVRDIVDMLAGFNGIVAVLPGNHDHYDSGAEVWKAFSEAISDKDRIVFLKEDRPYEFDGFVIYPAVCRSKHSIGNCLGWIKKQGLPNNGKFLIGMAHGTVEGKSRDDKNRYFLMTSEELYGIGMDVWLIGHTHVPFPADLTEEPAATKERIFNAGTHVQTDVHNNTEGLCFILELDGEKNLRAKKFVSGGLRFYRRTVEVSGDLEGTLKRELSGYGSNSYVDLIVKGAVSDDEYQRRGEIIENALAGFLEADHNYSQLSRLITEDEIKRVFPETSLYAKMLTELLDDPLRTQMAFDLLTKKEEKK